MIVETYRPLQPAPESTVMSLREASSRRFGRSDSSCSMEMERFLPTFESEDYDWMRFGWLLDDNDTQLPCIEEDGKRWTDSVKISSDIMDDLDVDMDFEEQESRQISDNFDDFATKIATKEPRAKSVDLPEFYLSDNDVEEEHEDFGEKVGLKYYEDPHQKIEMPKTPMVDQVPLNIWTSPVSIVHSDSDSDSETSVMSEPVARRTRSRTRSHSEDSKRDCEDSLFTTDVADDGQKDIHGDDTVPYDERLWSVSSAGEAPVMRETEDDQAMKEREEEKEEEEEEPIAKRTRRAGNSVGGFEDVHYLDAELPTASKSAPKRKLSQRKAGRKKLYCLCQTPYDRTRLYVGCDKCRGWFHPFCVGITEREAIRAKEFFCPTCAKQKVFSDDG